MDATCNTSAECRPLAAGLIADELGDCLKPEAPIERSIGSECLVDEEAQCVGCSFCVGAELSSFLIKGEKHAIAQCDARIE